MNIQVTGSIFPSFLVSILDRMQIVCVYRII